LQQQFFTATSTNFINGIPFEITTFPATSAVARALGAQALKAETSTNLALGAVLRVGGFDLTIDAYAIDMEDRIVLSENLTAANVRTFLTAQGFVGIGGGRFFINGVDTETRGVDFIGRYELETEAVGTFDFTLGVNVNETKVTRTPRTAQLAALNPAPILFDRNNVKVFEEGTPKDKVTFSTQWEMGRFGATLRAIRYGEVLSPGTTPALDLVLKPKTIVDLEGRFEITEQLQVAIGADNIFDEYPTQTPVNLNTTSNTPFSNFSPFGRSGRYVYGRISFGW
jgi:iron complex outermembrane recepter protein